MAVLPKIVGVINITPDSMSDGGLYCDYDDAIARVGTMIADGAAVIDVGGESTRPNASHVSQREEQQRLSPVLNDIIRISHAAGVGVSVDTKNYKTAEWALGLGADYLNDPSGLKDSNMLDLLKDSNDAKVIFVHSLSVPAESHIVLPNELDIVPFLIEWGLGKIDQLAGIGISADRLVFDPGIGFGKVRGHCWDIVRNVHTLKAALGIDVMIGHSKKTFLNPAAAAADRGIETLALSLTDSMLGASYIRVHDVLWHTKAFSILSCACLDGGPIF